MKYSAIIIGGGIIGTSIAYHLNQYMDEILIVDANHKGRATDAGAGIISGATTFSEEEALYEFVSQSSYYYHEFISDIQSLTDKPTGYRKSDEVIAAFHDEEKNKFNRIKNLILNRRDQHGDISGEVLFPSDPSSIESKFPLLAKTQNALIYKEAAQVDGKLLTEAIIDVITQHGVRIKFGLVEELVFEDKSCIGIKVNNEVILGDLIIISGGAWSTNFENQTGLFTGMKPQRGQIIHLQLPKSIMKNWEDITIPIIISMSDYYLLSWDDGKIVVGATREIDSGFNPDNSVEGVKQVLDQAMNMIPILKEARIEEIRVGLRPYSADKLPIIGKIPGYSGLWIATGHGPLGLTSAPLTGAVISQLILDHISPEELIDLKILDHFNPERFVHRGK